MTPAARRAAPRERMRGNDMMVFGTIGNDTLDAADGVTNGNDVIFGDLGDDKIFGLGGDDVILGDEGADHIDGGTGNDTASYLFAEAGVEVSLAQGQGFTGEADGDTLKNIENLDGSKFADLLVG